MGLGVVAGGRLGGGVWRTGAVVGGAACSIGDGAGGVGWSGRLWQPATARATRPRANGTRVRIGRMATSLLVLPPRSPWPVTAPTPTGLDRAAGWSPLSDEDRPAAPAEVAATSPHHADGGHDLAAPRRDHPALPGPESGRPARRPTPGGRPGELGLAEVEVLRVPWAMGAGGDRNLAADLLEGQPGYQQLPLASDGVWTNVDQAGAPGSQWASIRRPDRGVPRLLTTPGCEGCILRLPAGG